MGSVESNILSEINNIVLESRNDPKIETWEEELIRDFGSRVSVIITELDNFDNEGETITNPGPFNADYRKKFIQIFSSFVAIPTKFAKGISIRSTSIEYLQKVWTKILSRMEKSIEKGHSKIGIENWGISLGISFPMGVSGTISVTFKN